MTKTKSEIQKKAKQMFLKTKTTKKTHNKLENIK